MDDVTPVVAALSRSGFPLQTRVEHEIQARSPKWRVLAAEHPWRDPDGKDPFVDLLANCGTVLLVIECKRTRDRALTFLRPLGTDTTGLVTRATVRCVHEDTKGGRRWFTQVAEVELQPSSHRAQFCVASADQGSQRLLEQDARLVVMAADAVAGQSLVTELSGRSILVPVIVTTASLYTLRYEPTEVALDTDDFNKLDPKRIEPIQWVRFHKTLTTSGEERTVLVVNAPALPRVLDDISSWQLSR